ncbi:MAG: magnesium transporter CorA family protein [Bacteroides sp.]|nr:magnesium transporter CorA family protein [Eubacterium sp.]MCM1417350.1 magnesium transporter CorA family protein [Roseburia sp.]MCM1461457.1 magnesium transporter CorA family protein [Bacteroides sp.]
MLTFYKTVGNGLEELAELEAGCWISAVAPTEAEISMLEDDLGIDRDFLRSALDEEESSRIESDEGQTLIVLDYPVAEKSDGDEQTFSYYTLPMGIILTDSYVITVSLKENTIIDDFAKGVVKSVKTQFKTRFIFCILLRIAAKYLLFLKQIDKIFNYVQKQLHRSMKNKSLIQLLDLEKSLVYFSTSLKSTESVLEKLLRGRIIKLYEDDQELLEDVLVEVKQAIEMSNIYSNILSNTMDAYANVISNNLNQVMKVLTVITIVLELPNIVFSFYGMNTGDLPLPYTGFAGALGIVLAVAAGVVITKSKFYK